jgi:uncharacterized DUF497 family protein
VVAGWDATVRFEWDENKNQQNLLKHDVRFETAVLVFDDPYTLTRRDESSYEEECWITLGAIGPGAVVMVVHTWAEENGEEVVRLISARAATAHERRSYEKAYQGTKEGHRRHRSKKGRRH